MEAIWEFLTALSTIQLGVGLAISAAIIAIVIDWRLALFSLLVQYLFVALRLNALLPGGLALSKLLAGAFACVILYWTARRVDHELNEIEGGQEWFQANRDVYPMGLPFRFLALIFTSLVLFTLPETFLSIPLFPYSLTVPALWLLAMGLLGIILTRDPLKTGMGLLTFQNGFELLYTVVEPSITVIGLLGIGTILVALVASYLAIARHVPLIEAQQALKRKLDPHSAEALAEAVAALDKNPTTTEERGMQEEVVV